MKKWKLNKKKISEFWVLSNELDCLLTGTDIESEISYKIAIRMG